ncbi:hypothetical protein C8F01DRAFT_1264130 [Mycena amicta]|nr:hypothetical protein C8F01DRAFT_1264130 [Mycena amicta]
MSDIRLAVFEAESESEADEIETDAESVSQSDLHPSLPTPSANIPVTEDTHVYGSLTRRERAIVRTLREKSDYTLEAIGSLFASSPKTITLSRVCSNKMSPPDRPDRDALLVEEELIDELEARLAARKTMLEKKKATKTNNLKPHKNRPRSSRRKPRVTKVEASPPHAHKFKYSQPHIAGDVAAAATEKHKRTNDPHESDPPKKRLRSSLVHMPRQTSTQSSVPESEDAAYHGLFSENGSASNPMRHWQATALKTENNLELTRTPVPGITNLPKGQPDATMPKPEPRVESLHTVGFPEAKPVPRPRHVKEPTPFIPSLASLHPADALSPPKGMLMDTHIPVVHNFQNLHVSRIVSQQSVKPDDVKQPTPLLPYFAGVHPVDASLPSKATPLDAHLLFTSFLRRLEPTIDLSTRVDQFASNDIYDLADLRQYYSREYDDLVDTFDHMFRRRFLYEVQVGERIQKRLHQSHIRVVCNTDTLTELHVALCGSLLSETRLDSPERRLPVRTTTYSTDGATSFVITLRRIYLLVLCSVRMIHIHTITSPRFVHRRSGAKDAQQTRDDNYSKLFALVIVLLGR